MRGFIGLTKRNLLIYFKDIPAVFFSILTSIIVFVLYMVFLKGTYVDGINSTMGELENIIKTSDVELMVSLILLVGIVGSAMITVPFSCLQTVIKDRENKIDYDISATPIKRWMIILSYFMSAVISAFVVTGAILTVSLIVISQNGNINMNATTVIGTYGIVFLGCISSTAIFLILALFFKTSASSSAFFGILSAASGFVIGAYIPLSEFSEGVQTFCNIIPATQITVLLRNNLLNGVLDRINDGLGGIDQGAFVDAMRENFNFKVKLFGENLGNSGIYTYILAALVISIVVLVVIYSKTYKRR